MPQSVCTHTLANGMVLLAEPNDQVRSAAIHFRIPAGCAYDPPDRAGLASITVDMLSRGAGSRDKRQLALAFDLLGVDQAEAVAALETRLAGSTLARHLPEALRLYADLLLRPHFPPAELDDVRNLLLMDLQALDDEPQSKVLIELRQRHYPDPYGRDHRGTEAGLQAITLDDVRQFYQTHYRPNQTILAVAGNIDWDALRDLVEQLFGDWSGDAEALPQPAVNCPQNAHLDKDTAQTHIALAYPEVPLTHPDFYAANSAVGVLSYGMSSRLFTEVREKRGLCYSIYASYESAKDRAAVVAYAGTTTDAAQETLDVTVRELRRLIEGVTEDELNRVKVQMKYSLSAQEESTASRASSLARDWDYFGRVRSLAEIRGAYDALTPRRIQDHLTQHPPGPFTLVTIGRHPLRSPES